MSPVSGTKPTEIPIPVRDQLTLRSVYRLTSPAAARLALGGRGRRLARALSTVQGWLIAIAATHATAWVATMPAAFLVGLAGVSGPGAGWVVLGAWVGPAAAVCPVFYLHLTDHPDGRGDE